jgi:hypothetical protein
MATGTVSGIVAKPPKPVTNPVPKLTDDCHLAESQITSHRTNAKALAPLATRSRLRNVHT